jgi:hypothetical protein
LGGIAKALTDHLHKQLEILVESIKKSYKDFEDAALKFKNAIESCENADEKVELTEKQNVTMDETIDGIYQSFKKLVEQEKQICVVEESGAPTPLVQDVK